MSLLSVQLANVVVESCLVGLFMILNAVAMSHHFAPDRQMPSVLSKRVLKVVREPMFIGRVFLLMIIIAHWICTITRLFNAVIHFQGGTQALQYYADPSQSTYVVKESLLLASLIVGDGMIIYRSWKIWGRNYRVILAPSALLVGLVVSGVWATHSITREDKDATLTRWRKGYTVLTMLTNICGASMMTWRIWSTTQASESLGVYVEGGVNLSTFPSLFLEGTGIYTVWTVFYGTSSLIDSDIRELAADTLPVTAGLAFAAVKARYAWARRPGALESTQSRGNPSYPMRQLSFRVPTSDSVPGRVSFENIVAESEPRPEGKKSVDIL